MVMQRILKNQMQMRCNGLKQPNLVSSIYVYTSYRFNNNNQLNNIYQQTSRGSSSW